MEEMSYVFSSNFFFTARSFSPCIGGHWHFPFCHRRYKIFMLFFQQKKCLLCFLSLALDLCRPFSRWASLACRLLSLFLCLSLALYSKFVGMTINLSLILWTARIQKQFPLSFFIFINSLLVVSALQDAGGYAISRQNNLELHLGCHTCWLSYFTFVHLWGGRKVGRVGGRSVTCYQNFSDG